MLQTAQVLEKMTGTLPYTVKVLERAIRKNPGEPEFHQALTEILPTLQPVIDEHPEYQSAGILERIVEPERQIMFRVPWVDDKGKVRVNKGYRIQFNSVLGPYKGGLRFHPTVNASIVKFLGFEQIFKNSLTGLPIGGGKGGSDFNPKGKSDREVMAFCQSFITELYRHIGADTDVPAGDIGVGGREIGFMYGQYKRLTGLFGGILTGKDISYGGSPVRTEATGYGLVYLVERMLNDINLTFDGKTVVISGSGNVAAYAAKKCIQLGAKVVTMSDSDGFIHVPGGINTETVKQIKEVKRGRISEYLEYDKNARYFARGEKLVWEIPCDIALPCATENELRADGAEFLVNNGCKAIAEGSNMSTTLDAVDILHENNVMFVQGKAANAGGVAVSALEMAQNSARRTWTFDEVDAMLKDIMCNIYSNIASAAERYGVKGNLVAGANIAGFERVAQAMLIQGIV